MWRNIFTKWGGATNEDLIWFPKVNWAQKAILLTEVKQGNIILGETQIVNFLPFIPYIFFYANERYGKLKGRPTVDVKKSFPKKGEATNEDLIWFLKENWAQKAILLKDVLKQGNNILGETLIDNVCTLHDIYTDALVMFLSL